VFCCDLEDESLLSAVGVGELDLSVESSRSQQRRVERVLSVGRHDHLDVDGLVESVHLVEQLEKNALHLAIGTSLSIETLRSNRINLILGKKTEKSHTENIVGDNE